MILLFLLGCTAHMNHIEESFHRIVPVDLAVFVLPFSALRRSLQSSVCKTRVVFSNCRYGRSWGRGRCFPVKRKWLEQCVNVVFASFARFADEFQYSIIRNLYS